MEFQYPKTKLRDVIDFYKARKAEFNLAHIRIEIGQNQKQTLEHYEKRIKHINEEYFPFFDFKDFHIFKKLNDLENFLLNLNIFTPTKIKKSIQHEKEHLKKIIELGYSANFGCIFTLTEKQKPSYVLMVVTPLDSLMSKEHRKKIDLAPKKPSLIDLC